MTAGGSGRQRVVAAGLAWEPERAWVPRTLIAALCLLVAAFGWSRPLAADSDSITLTPGRSLAFHPFTLSVGGCTAGESHVYFGLAFGDCDPVNLYFKSLDIHTIEAALRRRGWTEFGLGSTQWLHLTDESTPVPVEKQLYYYQRGGDGDCPPSVSLCRFHLRLWQAPGSGVLGAAHFEGGGLFLHTLLQSWEYAESRVCSDLELIPGLRCRPNALFLATQQATQAGPYWRAANGFSGYNDALMTVIERR